MKKADITSDAKFEHFINNSLNDNCITYINIAVRYTVYGYCNLPSILNIIKMKNRIFKIGKFLTFVMFISVIFFSVTSCRDEEKTKTVVIEKEVEKAKVKEKESDGTSINVDGDGVEFSTKKGDNKTEVNIKD